MTEQVYSGRTGGAEGELPALLGESGKAHAPAKCSLTVGRWDSICCSGIKGLHGSPFVFEAVFKSFFFLNKVGNKQNQIVINFKLHD